MDLKKLFSTAAVILCVCFALMGQESEAESQCIDPAFQTEIESYLSDAVPTITVADAYPERTAYTFLDARELKEYSVSHIENAIHVGYENFDIDSVSDLDKDTPIIIYCSIGYRSEKIGKLMIDAGFTSVQNLYGSIFEWVNQHHSIYSADGTETQKIHAYNRSWSKWIRNDLLEITW